MRILRDEWSDIAKKYTSSIKNLYPKLNDEETIILRKKGYMNFTDVDGTVFVTIGVGYATNGFSMQAGRMSGKLLRQLKHYEGNIIQNEKAIIDAINDHSKNKIKELDIKLKIHDWYFYFFENNSQLYLRFNE